jgi:hypothetical protein
MACPFENINPDKTIIIYGEDFKICFFGSVSAWSPFEHRIWSTLVGIEAGGRYAFHDRRQGKRSIFI